MKNTEGEVYVPLTVEKLIEILQKLPNQKIPVEIACDEGEFYTRLVWGPLIDEEVNLRKDGKVLRIGFSSVGSHF